MSARTRRWGYGVLAVGMGCLTCALVLFPAVMVGLDLLPPIDTSGPALGLLLSTALTATMATVLAWVVALPCGAVAAWAAAEYRRRG